MFSSAGPPPLLPRCKAHPPAHWPAAAPPPVNPVWRIGVHAPPLATRLCGRPARPPPHPPLTGGRALWGGDRRHNEKQNGAKVWGGAPPHGFVGGGAPSLHGRTLPTVSINATRSLLSPVHSLPRFHRPPWPPLRPQQQNTVVCTVHTVYIQSYPIHLLQGAVPAPARLARPILYSRYCTVLTVSGRPGGRQSGGAGSPRDEPDASLRPRPTVCPPILCDTRKRAAGAQPSNQGTACWHWPGMAACCTYL